MSFTLFALYVVCTDYICMLCRTVWLDTMWEKWK